MSKAEEFDCLYFIADYHALNTIKNKELFSEYTYVIAATWLACGLDPEKEIQGNDDYKKLISLLKADAPQAKIVLITPFGRK